MLADSTVLGLRAHPENRRVVVSSQIKGLGSRPRTDCLRPGPVKLGAPKQGDQVRLGSWGNSTFSQGAYEGRESKTLESEAMKATPGSELLSFSSLPYHDGN